MMPKLVGERAARPTPIVVFGSTRFQDGWLTEHHLARRLARRRSVLFVEPFMSPLSGLRRVDGPRTPREVRDAARVRLHDGVAVVSPLALPPVRDPRALRASRRFVAGQLRRAMSTAGIDRPVSLIAFGGPEVVGLAGEQGHVLLVKDLNEAEPELLGVSAARLRADLASVAAGARAVVVISRALQETLAQRGIASHLVPHGYDDGRPGARMQPPADLAALPRPWLGYLGRIDGRLDGELLAQIARRYDGGTVVMVGPVGAGGQEVLRALDDLPNVAMLGPRPRSDVSTYLAHFDCALLPYRAGAWGDHGSPLKLWDYLGAGTPIVGSGYSVLADFSPPLAWYGQTPVQAVAMIDEAMASGDAGRQSRLDYAQANSWDLRVRDFERVAGIEMR